MFDRKRVIIPNFITAMNMFMGFMAMTWVIDGEFDKAIWTIYLATFLDLLDGRLARALNASTRFGIEFDSFSDLVTFGLAPSLLLYQVFFVDYPRATAVIAFLPALFAALRLARFNIQWGKSDKRYMQGVATPVSAVVLIGFVAFDAEVWGDFGNQPLLAAVIIISICILMVSNIRYESNSLSNWRDPAVSWKLLPFALSVISVVVWGAPAFFLWGSLYVLLGVLRWMIAHRPRRDNAEVIA